MDPMTKKVLIEDITLIAPVQYEELYKTLDEVPDCCGAGDGLGERLIPEYFLGLRISIVCDIHDVDFEVAPPTWQAFHAASNRLARNSYAVIRARSNFLMGYFRILLAATYFYGVDTKGAIIFKQLKQRQGFEVN